MRELASLLNSEFDRLKSLTSEVSAELNSLNVLQGKIDMTKNSLDKVGDEISSALARIDNLHIIEAYLKQFADERQEQVYRQIETTVTEGLRAVFQEELSLEISTKMVGSRTETVFNLVSDAGGEVLTTSIMDSRGGGVAAIVGFLIQAVLVLLTPGMRPILFLDETFRNVSEDYQAPLGEFIRNLCDKTGLQVVLVTHQPTIAEYSTNWYTFSQKDGTTIISLER